MRHFLRQYVTYSIGIALNRAAVLFLLPLYTRYLTPADYGVLDILMTYVALLQPMLLIGVDTAVQILYFDARTVANRSQSNLVMTSIGLVMLCAGALALAGYITSGIAANALFGSAVYTVVLQLLFIDAFVMCLFKLFHDNLRIREKPLLYSLLPLIQIIMMTILNVYFVVVQQLGVKGYIWGLLFADVAVMLISALLVLPHYLSGRISLEHLKSLLHVGLPLLPVSLAYWVLNLSDRFFLIKIATTEVVGVYGIAYRLATAISIFTLAVQLGWRPFALRIQRESSARSIYAAMPLYYFVVVGWIGLVVAELSPILLRLFTTEAYYGAAAFITPLILAQIVYGAYFIFSTGVEITKRTYHITWTVFLAAGINICLNVLLIPSLSAFGASLATVGSYVSAVTLVALVSYIIYPLPYDRRRLFTVCTILLVAYSGMTIGHYINPETATITGFMILVVTAILFGWLFHEELLWTLNSAWGYWQKDRVNACSKAS